MPVSENDDELYQRGLIITDNKAPVPILDFEAYQKVLCKIITSSYPNFTIGIYGDWGTGKTTLMSAIKEELTLNTKNVVTVWFDAWRYENEKDFALIPLLKTINYAINENDADKRNLKEALKEAAIFTLGVSRDIVSSTVTRYIGENLGGLFKKSLEDVTTKLIPKLRRLSEIDKNAIFFQGIQRIQDEINKLRSNDRDFRFVVFVDDLDRCSEEKVLEVLESIKVFLSLNGFIYVLGVSHDKVAELITRKYGTDGEQYLRKFVQIPVTLAEWNASDIKLLIEDFLLKDIIHEDYKSIVKDNIETITRTLEENPRETKRFINNLIISYEVFVKIQDLKESEEKEKFLKELLLVQIVSSSWRDLYKRIITSEGGLLEKLKPFVPLDINKVRENLDAKTETQIDPQVREIFEKYKSNTKLWVFLSKENLDILMGVSDWNVFRRAVRLTEEKSLAIKEWSKKALELLMAGSIDEFNEKRLKYFSELNLEDEWLTGANLSGANLSGANLSGANLSAANLSGANFTGANLKGSIIEGANLDGANLDRANLEWAYFGRTSLERTSLKYANLSGANLKGASLGRANLLGANLSAANLEGANLDEALLEQTHLSGTRLVGALLTKAFIINPKNYESLILNEKTQFNDAIIDDSGFIEYIRNFVKVVPKKIKDKNELKSMLDERKLPRSIMDEILGLSMLS